MKKKYILTPLLFVIILTLTGCSFSSTGNSLYGFTQRMNQFPEQYNLTQTGYIFNEQNHTLTRFFKFGNDEIMLQFEYADENELSCLHIVFDNNCKNNSQAVKFAENCIEAYIENKEITEELMNKIDFKTAINTPSYETKQAKSGDTELLLDTTAIGTVISVSRNTQ